MTADAAWQEQDSGDFLAYGRYFVPYRQMQADVITAVIPPQDGSFTALDLCCGDGMLSESILAAFPKANVVGLDMSPTMLSAADKRLGQYRDRFHAQRFDLVDRAWRAEWRGAHAVVSSLAVHHLDAGGKQRLFADVHSMLAPGGAFVLADLIQPLSGTGLALASRMWDELVRENSLTATSGLEPYERFHALEWNSYQYPDPLDSPSPLPDQLNWLREAGFGQVDVYWMVAGHAIFGGVRRDD